MKKMFSGLMVVSMFFAFGVSAVHAKCYRFSLAGSEVGVCVRGDSFADRKKAKEICDKGEGKDCGNITSYSSSCHSNSNRCYDENGRKHRSLSGY